MSLASRLGTVALVVLALCAETPTPRPAKPLPLPLGNGAWVAQLTVSGGQLYRAKTYTIDSAGHAQIEITTPGQDSPPSSWPLGSGDVGKVGASVAASAPGSWSINPVICCNGTYYTLVVRARSKDGHRWRHRAAWNASQSNRESPDARSIASNVLLAFERAGAGRR